MCLAVPAKIIRRIDMKTKEMIYGYADYFNQQEGRKYPCSNQIVTCIYITDNPQEVYDYLNKNNIEPIRKRKDYIEWRENDEKWIWMPIKDTIRSYRFYKVKISKDYDNKEKLRYLIIPYCGLYCCSWEVL